MPSKATKETKQIWRQICNRVVFLLWKDKNSNSIVKEKRTCLNDGYIFNGNLYSLLPSVFLLDILYSISPSPNWGEGLFNFSWDNGYLFDLTLSLNVDQPWSVFVGIAISGYELIGFAIYISDELDLKVNLTLPMLRLYQLKWGK